MSTSERPAVVEPAGVRLVFADDPDREVPVECVYLCQEIERVSGRLERLHVWLALSPRDEPPARVLVAFLPAHTSIRVGWSL